MEINLTSKYAAEELKAKQTLMMVMDPELGINVQDLGLIYSLDFSNANKLIVEMTLTTPACPMAETILLGVERSLKNTFSDKEIIIQLVWDPEWNIDRMTQEGRDELNRK